MSIRLEPEMTRQASPSAISSLVSLFVAVALGLGAAFLLFPDRGSQLAASLLGSSPKAYWYMSRGAAFVALVLLWISMMLGLLITDKLARSWPGAPVAFALHEFVSLLGLVFAVFHALILLGDRYINYKLAQILMPFGSVNYHPVWVGVGQIGLYLWAIISASFYVRQMIGHKTWKFIHYASFFNFMIAVMHGLASGTDTAVPWAQALYWFLGGSVLFLTVYRIVAGSIQPATRPAPVRSISSQQQSRQ